MSTATLTKIRRASQPHPIYFAECNYGRPGIAFRETDRDSNSRSTIISLMVSGEIDAIKIIEVIEPCEDFPLGRVTDVTLEMQLEASVLEAA